MRAIALASGLDEVLKWGQPCYALDGKNVVVIHTFKEYCAFLFFKGALLKDPGNILIQQTEKVQSARQIRFTNARQIDKLKPVLKAYIEQAIEVEKSGAKVKLKSVSEYPVAEEFQRRLDELPALKAAFDTFDPRAAKGLPVLFFRRQEELNAGSSCGKVHPADSQGTGT